MEKVKLTKWIKIFLPLILALAGLAYMTFLLKEQAVESQRVHEAYLEEQQKKIDAWKNSIILEDRIGTEEKSYISYEVQEEKVLVTTPYYTFTVPASWIGHCKMIVSQDNEHYYDWISEETYTPESSRDPNLYEVRIYHHTIDGVQTLLATVCLYNEIINWYDEYSHNDYTEYIGLLSHLTKDRSTYRIHFFYEKSDEWTRDETFYDMQYELSDVMKSIEVRTHLDDGTWMHIDREHSAYSEYMEHFHNHYLWRNKYYNVTLPKAYYDQLEKEKQAAIEKARQDKLLEEEKKRAQQRRAASKASKGSNKTDPYDVYDYDDPDDFADYWEEEFDDEWSDEDEAWDDAYDYWVEHH